MDKDREKIREEVKGMVESFLSDKEESKVRAKMEEALTEAKETILSLTQDVTDKEASISGFEGEIESKDSSITSLNEKITELETALESLTQEKQEALDKASGYESDLTEIRKEQIADLRLAKVIEAKLIRETDEVKEKTKAKVKEMSDEEFDTYVEDLNEVKSSFLEELKKLKDADEDDSNKDEGSEDDCECGKDDCEKCKPVKEDSELAALDIETAPSEDLVDKFKNAFKEAGMLKEE